MMAIYRILSDIRFACVWLIFIVLINDLRTVQCNGSDRILSRKRRYLTFPKGSALQLVYDTYYPILENNNVGVIGITAALAWELPSEPLHVDEVLQGAYENGKQPLLNRKSGFNTDNSTDNGQSVTSPATGYSYTSNDTSRYQSNIEYATKSPISQPARVDNVYYSNGNVAPKKSDTGSVERPAKQENLYYSKFMSPNRYYTQNTYGNSYEVTQKPGQTILDQISNKMDYYFSYADKFLNGIHDMTTDKYKPWQHANWGHPNERIRPPYRPAYQIYKSPNQGRHFIHPIFKRHAIDESISHVDIHHLKVHRATRHTFYNKLTRFMDMRKIDGLDCVLKALCETGQRRTDATPGSFLTEIFRAIFSLPDAKWSDSNSKNRIYDDAHLLTENCADKFFKCEGSIWSPDFKFAFNKMQMS